MIVLLEEESESMGVLGIWLKYPLALAVIFVLVK